MSFYKDHEIGNCIKNIREVKGITQKKMSELLDIPYSTYSNYENNNREPSPDTLVKIANVLDVSISDFLSQGTFLIESFARYDTLFKIAFALEKEQNKYEELDKIINNSIGPAEIDDALEELQHFEDLEKLNNEVLKDMQSIFNKFGYTFYYDYNEEKFNIEKNEDGTGVYVTSTELIFFFDNIERLIKDKIDNLINNNSLS